MQTDSTPFDEEPWIAGLRFALELVAWLAIFFAWGWVPLVLAVAALALFNVRGDKHVVLLQVGGPIRIGLEALVAAVGIVAAFVNWGIAAGLPLLVAFLALFALSHRRVAWLWRR